MQSSRNKYKCLLHSKEIQSNNSFSNDLADALLTKKGDVFWKCWKSKVNQRGSSQVVDGIAELRGIATAFADFSRTVIRTTQHASTTCY